MSKYIENLRALFQAGTCRQLIFGAFFFAAFLFGPGAAEAGSLFLSPATGVYTAGNTFTVRVLLNTSGQAINAAEGSLTFNPSEVSVARVSQAGSIFNLWTVEPEFSNAFGTITFGGGSPKGYTGSSGNIMTITFRALKEGTSRVDFKSGAILAADGKGTNIISSMGSGVYTLQSKQVKPKAEYVAPDNTPAAPNITSTTHPDDTDWYPLHTAELAWDVPSDVTAIRLLVDQDSFTIPSVFYSSPIDKKTVEDLDEGVWYFHAQMQNKHGWGKIRHFRIGVDSTKPEHFTIREPEEQDTTDPRLKFFFDAYDEISGIDRYEVLIDDNEPEIWKDDGTHLYAVPTLPPGRHTMVVKAYDGADNHLVDTISFVIEALGPPVFTHYPRVLDSGSILVVKGASISNSKVTLTLQRDKEDPVAYEIESDAEGLFTFIAEDRLPDGIYRMWAEVVDDRGARSEMSEKVRIAVQPPGIIRIGSLALNILSVVIPLIALILLLIFMGVYGSHRLVLLRRRLRKETAEAQSVLHASFENLRKEVYASIKLLETTGRKRHLTKEEEHTKEKLKKNLAEAEKRVSKEIKDIEKELR